MEQIINHSDTSFFEEINYLLTQRLAAQSAYEDVLEMLFEKLEGHAKVNTDIGLLLAYGKEAFDEQTMTSSSIVYLRNLGHTSSQVLAIIEKLRYELRASSTEPSPGSGQHETRAASALQDLEVSLQLLHHRL